MTIQLSSMFHLAEDAKKVLSLFFTYNGSTHSITVNHDAMDTPEAMKSTLLTAVGALVDAYIAAKL